MIQVLREVQRIKVKRFLECRALIDGSNVSNLCPYWFQIRIGQRHFFHFRFVTKLESLFEPLATLFQISQLARIASQVVAKKVIIWKLIHDREQNIPSILSALH